MRFGVDEILIKTQRLLLKAGHFLLRIPSLNMSSSSMYALVALTLYVLAVGVGPSEARRGPVLINPWFKTACLPANLKVCPNHSNKAVS